jgi:hypothetical protein
LFGALSNQQAGAPCGLGGSATGVLITDRSHRPSGGDLQTALARAQRPEGILEPDTWVFVAWYSWLVVLLATIAYIVFH